jgi:hypothetical protein
MDEPKPDTINAVPTRLKFFLARQVEERRSRKLENIREQPAAILAAMMWMEESGIHLTQKELGRLLDMNRMADGKEHQTQICTALNMLKRKKFIDEDKKVILKYRINPDGVQAVHRYANDVLGIPKEIEDVLQAEPFKTAFRQLTAESDRLIRHFLLSRFAQVRGKKKQKDAPQE